MWFASGSFFSTLRDPVSLGPALCLFSVYSMQVCNHCLISSFGVFSVLFFLSHLKPMTSMINFVCSVELVVTGQAERESSGRVDRSPLL